VAISAQYPGFCVAECGYPIREGQMIEHVDPVTEPAGWQHVQCPTDPTAGFPLCSRCFCRHAGEC
jgi:hypothetical protein